MDKILYIYLILGFIDNFLSHKIEFELSKKQWGHILSDRDIHVIVFIAIQLLAPFTIFISIKNYIVTAYVIYKVKRLIKTLKKKYGVK